MDHLGDLVVDRTHTQTVLSVVRPASAIQPPPSEISSRFEIQYRVACTREKRKWRATRRSGKQIANGELAAHDLSAVVGKILESLAAFVRIATPPRCGSEAFNFNPRAIARSRRRFIKCRVVCHDFLRVPTMDQGLLNELMETLQRIGWGSASTKSKSHVQRSSSHLAHGSFCGGRFRVRR